MKLKYVSHVAETGFAVIALKCRQRTAEKRIDKIEGLSNRIEKIVYDDRNRVTKIYFNCRLNVTESAEILTELGVL